MRTPWLVAWLGLLLCAPVGAAQSGVQSGLQPLSDSALAAVRGRDGVSFDLAGFALSGDARLSYGAPSGAGLYVEGVTASRSDSPDPFGDPYRLDIVRGRAGLADVVQLAFPVNRDGAQRWQFAYDWGVHADSIARYGGSVLLSDAVFRGGGLQFSTPQANDGVAFGLALNLTVGELALRPRGRGDAGGQMALGGIRLGGVDQDGNFNNTAWALADVAAQPAVINALADASGARLHIGIGWPDTRFGNGAAAAGGLQINNISFAGAGAGQAPVDLGSSRIGSMQLQYLDVKFRR